MVFYLRVSTWLTACVASATLYGTADQQAIRAQTMAGLTQYIIGNPNGDETEILQIINRARANPAAEGQRIVDSLTALRMNATMVDTKLLLAQFQSYTVQPPVAFNAYLNASAQAHVADMVATGLLQHESSDGTPEDIRVKSFGYATPMGENIAAGYLSVVAPWLTEGRYEVDYGQADFGHRWNVFTPDLLGSVEVGIAQQPNGWNTTDFGLNNTSTLVTGAVFTDDAGTGFYASGEGVGSMVVTAPGASSYYAVTVDSGAYTLPLDLLIFDPAVANPTVQIVFTDAPGNVTRRAVVLNHTALDGGLTTYTDAGGQVRYDNAEVDLIESATVTPTPTPAPVGSTPEVSVTSGVGGDSFVFARTGDTSHPLVVNYVVKGTAVAAVDYVPLSGRKKFKSGKGSVRITVQTLPGARGTVKLKIVPVNNSSYRVSAPDQVKIRVVAT